MRQNDVSYFGVEGDDAALGESGGGEKDFPGIRDCQFSIIELDFLFTQAGRILLLFAPPRVNGRYYLERHLPFTSIAKPASEHWLLGRMRSILAFLARMTFRGAAQQTR